jgi:hypothetical protein
MEFGFWDTVFLIGLVVFFLFRDLKNRFQTKENEIDRVLREAEQVKYKDIIICKSEIVNGQIFVYEKKTSAFITQQPNVETMVKFFVNNYPNKTIIFGEQ